VIGVNGPAQRFMPLHGGEQIRKNSFDYVAYGQRLRSARKRAGITQTELERRIGWTHGIACHHEHGRLGPSVSTLIALCDALNVSADWLLGRAP